MPVNISKLPPELLTQARFFPVTLTSDGRKVPTIKGWQKPENQMTAEQALKQSELIGFDTSGHGVADDYVLLDFDHVLDDKGNFNPHAEDLFCSLQRKLGGFAEKSISGHGLHILLKPTADKFSTVNPGSKGGVLFFDESANVKLEVFYKTNGRYCLLTGNLFKTDSTQIATGDVADKVFADILKRIQKSIPKKNETPPVTKKRGTPTPQVWFDSATDYDQFRARIMLDTIDPQKLSDSDWLAVMSACKNIGIPYSVVDEFNRRDPKRHNEKENETRWQSLKDPSYDIEVLHGIAKRFGYSEKSARQEWYNLRPELSTKKKSADRRADYQQAAQIDEDEVLFADWESYNGKINPDMRPKIKAAAEYLKSLTPLHLTATEASASKTKHALAICQFYDFYADITSKFYAKVREAKNAVKTVSTMIQKEGSDFVNGDFEAKSLSEVSIRDLKADVDKLFLQYKRAHKDFQKSEKKRLADEERTRQKAEHAAQVEKLTEKLKRLRAMKPSKDRDAALVETIRDACDWKYDMHHTPIAVKNTAYNVDLIFTYDPKLDGLFGYDDFEQRDVYLKRPPWSDDICKYDEWTDRDDNQLQLYIRRTYTEFADEKLYRQALTAYSEANKFHAVKQYFNELPKWDGTPRAEELFIKYLRVDDTPFTREVTLNWLTGAVARIFHPGCNFQTAIVLHGNQGIGKSYLLEKLGQKWYATISDNVDDPHVFDTIKSVWIGELKEMKSLRKADINSIKAFIDTAVDTRREAYARRERRFKRHCVFAITVNDDQFLSDMTGNRRFPILHCNSSAGDYVEGLTDEFISQIWAEVYYRYNELFKNGFDAKKLELSRSAKIEVEAIAENYLRNDIGGEIKEFVDTKIPDEVVWNLLSKEERRKYFADGNRLAINGGETDLISRRKAYGKKRTLQQDLHKIREICNGKKIARTTDNQLIIYGSVYRKHITAAEIYNEAFPNNDRRKTMPLIRDNLSNLTGWTCIGRKQHYPGYGDQTQVFLRNEDNYPIDDDDTENQTSNQNSQSGISGEPVGSDVACPFDIDQF